MEPQLLGQLHNISINLGPKGQSLTQNVNNSLQSAGYLSVILSALFLLQFLNKWRGREQGKSDKREDGAVGMDVIPCPKPFFIKYIGCAFQFLPLKETLNKTLAWHKLYGSCMRVAAANYHGILVYSASLAQCFLKSGDFGHVSKEGMPFYDIMRPFLGKGLLISEGSYWQKRRKILMRSMTFQSLRNYTSLLNKHSKRFVDSLDKLYADDGEHPFNVQINSSFLAIITEILTGSDIEDMTQVAEYHHHFQTWKECLLARIETPCFLLDFLWKLHPMARVHDKAIENMNTFAIQRLKEHKVRREQLAKIQSESSTDSHFSNDEFRCTLDEMMDAGVSDEEIVHEINTLLFGGHETTATTIHFFFFLMALHPQYQELCRKEIDQVFEDPSQVSNGNLSFEALNNLKNVERCLFETMRLLPVAFGFMRNLKTSLNIEYEGKTVHVPAGTCILIVPWVIHRNEKDYPEPEKFDPDRFLPDECAKRHPYAYLPFSAGPRNCIGLKFGMNEMKTVAAYVLRNFELSTSDKLEDVVLLPNITLTPERDYNFRLRRRVL